MHVPVLTTVQLADLATTTPGESRTFTLPDGSLFTITVAPYDAAFAVCPRCSDPYCPVCDPVTGDPDADPADLPDCNSHGEIQAVDVSERWSRVDRIEDGAFGVGEGDDDYGDTLYYRCGYDHVLSMPVGIEEGTWS